LCDEAVFLISSSTPELLMKGCCELSDSLFDKRTGFLIHKQLFYLSDLPQNNTMD
jgi:hypothetical protein